MSLPLGLEVCEPGGEMPNGLFWWFIVGEGDLEGTFFEPSVKVVSWKELNLFDDKLDDTMAGVAAVDDDPVTIVGGGDEFDKRDVEDVEEFLGMIEWKADPLLAVAVGLDEIGLGGFGEDAGEPVDPTLGGGGGNE